MLARIRFFIPLFIFLLLLGFFAQTLFYPKKNELPSTLINQPLPPFVLSCFVPSKKLFSHKTLLGEVTLVNVWATWCPACEYEHAMLMKIKNQYHVSIYGIAYKDTDEAVKTWLQKNGNPYVLVANDEKGNVGIDLGVYGTPETFVISPQGKIIYRHVGIIDENTWNNRLYPLIKKYQVNS